MRRLVSNSIFIAATGQHVGKTTVSLGIMSILTKKVQRLGFIKPVGQSTVTYEGETVDKDVPFFKDHFHITQNVRDMSPVVASAGFTRKVLDNCVDLTFLREQVKGAFARVASNSDFVVVEGTGHCGVGSIFHLSNAHVAASLNVDVIMIVPGGLGSSFDQLALNKALLDQTGARLAGVIINKVDPAKLDMVKRYYQIALSRWDVPLLGCIPHISILSAPSLEQIQMHLKAEVCDRFVLG